MQIELGPRGEMRKKFSSVCREDKEKFKDDQELGIKVVNLKKLNIIFLVPFWAVGLWLSSGMLAHINLPNQLATRIFCGL